MAEMLGLVASVVSVTQVAGQVGVSVMKLQRLWSEVKNVPESINALMMHLELLYPMLSEIEKQYSHSPATIQADRLAMLSLEHARQAAQNLEKLVEDLHQQLESTRKVKRGVSKAKAVLRKDLICTYKERLQHALQLLSLSQQAHQIALSKIQTSLVVLEIQSLKKEGRDREQRSGNSLHTCKHTHIQQSEKYCTRTRGLSWKNSTLVWRFTSRMTEVSGSPDEADKVYEARLQLPLWLVPMAWDLQVRKSYSGWNICLKPWTIRPYNSDSFLYCLEGSTEDLSRALTSNQASIYDRDPGGWTLLHYASWKGHFDLFKKLLELGLSVDEEDISGITPLYYLGKAEDGQERSLDVYRLLSSRGELDEVTQDVFSPTYRTSKKSSLYRFVWTNKEFLDFIITHIHSNFQERPGDNRYKSINWMYVDPEVLLQALMNDNTISSIRFINQISENPQSSLHELARLYFRTCLSSFDRYGNYTNNYGFSHWRGLLRWIAVGISSQDISRVGHEPWAYATPLFAGLLSCDLMLSGSVSDSRYAHRRLSGAIHIWLEDLQRAGVDLQSYGEHERDFYKQDDWLHAWHWSNLACAGEEGPVLASFDYGCRPEEWRFRWEPAIEAFVGHFWAALEEQAARIPSMPGGWESE